MRVAIVGGTGLVGQKMIQVLEERSFPVKELIPVASERSKGREVLFGGKPWKVCTLEDAVSAKPDIALFSAGASVSTEWAPQFVEAGAWVIDNSSAWRMDPTVPLVVPEINFEAITPSTKLIANPNCSTIQLVMVLHPLHLAFGLTRVIVSTYQAVTGTGKKAVDQLMEERESKTSISQAYPHPIDLNCIPQCDSFLDSGYTKEEMKVVNESRKIMALPYLSVSATAVRVPVVGGHSESVYVELGQQTSRDKIHQLLQSKPGIVVQDDPSSSYYPMPLEAHEKDEVFVGRIRADLTQPNAWLLWVVSDNLRKGAATNSVQIAEQLVNTGLLS